MKEHRQILTERSCSIISSRENTKFILYKGSSMSSTLQDMDVLYYIPHKRIRPGDVVVIKISEYGNKIIHRVISVGEQGIRTMGDCNPHPDRWLLSPDQIMGSVAYGYRGRKRFIVQGGPAGLVKMFWVRFKHHIVKTMYSIFMIFCNFVSHSTIPLIHPKLIAFKHPDGIELQIMFLGRIIGKRLPEQNWQIKFPFKLFIDKNRLPNQEML